MSFLIKNLIISYELRSLRKIHEKKIRKICKKNGVASQLSEKFNLLLMTLLVTTLTLKSEGRQAVQEDKKTRRRQEEKYLFILRHFLLLG